jgi:hypothetical protein
MTVHTPSFKYRQDKIFFWKLTNYASGTADNSLACLLPSRQTFRALLVVMSDALFIPILLPRCSPHLGYCFAWALTLSRTATLRSCTARPYDFSV